ncbi:MAG: hypothetical protein AB9869_22340 [Verrucomicrobiia bacterium]
MTEPTVLASKPVSRAHWRTAMTLLVRVRSDRAVTFSHWSHSVMASVTVIARFAVMSVTTSEVSRWIWEAVSSSGTFALLTTASASSRVVQKVLRVRFEPSSVVISTCQKLESGGLRSYMVLGDGLRCYTIVAREGAAQDELMVVFRWNWRCNQRPMKALKCFKGGCFPLGLLLLCSITRNDAASPIVYQATGTREQIQPVIDQFEHDILYGIGGDPQQSPILGSVKTVTFDDVSAGSEKTVEWSGAGKSGGVVLPVPPGDLFSVSAGTADPNNPNRLFGDIHSSYLTEFAPFSSPSILALRRPGFNDPAISIVFAGRVDDSMKGIGAVFVDVDSPTSAYFQVNRFPLPQLRFDVPSAPGHADFSFLGLLMEEGETFPTRFTRRCCATPSVQWGRRR